MDSHLLLARVKHEFQIMTLDILCIQVLLANCSHFDFHNKRGCFASFIERPLNEMGVKRVCKLCILGHFHERVPDHDRYLQSPI